ncbi:ABC transporter ATP-binding protein/permease [Rhizobium oryzicola]|uniref:ABC transporter ATP-binding protein/permease n=1 Tax=Rhizobium oryzicola TaxID=1232668 RepID=A0ABT8T200_9HYPH|nr:ABC transporter ATP-binding protein/permease [Rhizobium oryzicola]MDO1584211.1 ABC transporter ATP-binding protein/permease [Rhizobium oryzicola]
MAEPAQTADKTSEFETETADFSFFAQLKMMGSAFWSSHVRTRLLCLAAALLTIILLTVYMQYRLNQWNTPFYNALEQRNLPAFFEQLKVFAVIAGSLLVLNVIQAWLNQMTSLNMRDGLTRDLVDQWMRPRRALKLANSSPLGVNPDQRLHEDARNLAEITTNLSIGLVNATILLISFVGVLWAISSDFALRLWGMEVVIPGYMVWAALIYAGSASALSNFVGRRMPRLNTERYSKEAELRFALMHANENLMPITLTNGEENERRRIQQSVTAVLIILRRLALAMTNLTWVSSGFGWLTTIAPILIAAPAYFGGYLTFGGLMMAVGAFNQVNTALRWYIDNFRPIADWKAALYRVSVFRRALLQMDDLTDIPGSSLSISHSEGGSIVLRDIELRPGTASTGAERGVILTGETQITQGERVMVNGDPRANRHLLFLALAGLWPWGKGEIRLPGLSDMLFIAQKGYLPDATLREVLAYPNSPDDYSQEQMIEALDRVELHGLIEKLSARDRWERTLDEEDQMRLRLANAILIAPKWIVLDDALETLDPQTQHEILKLLNGFTDAAIIYIGRSEVFLSISPRAIHLQALTPSAEPH